MTAERRRARGDLERGTAERRGAARRTRANEQDDGGAEAREGRLGARHSRATRSSAPNASERTDITAERRRARGDLERGTAERRGAARRTRANEQDDGRLATRQPAVELLQRARHRGRLLDGAGVAGARDELEPRARDLVRRAARP